MPIIITNVTPFSTAKGEHEYEVRINSKPLFRFTHNREDSIFVLLKAAALAAGRIEVKKLVAKLNGE